MKNKQHTLPSFFLISSAVDGNENAIGTRSRRMHLQGMRPERITRISDRTRSDKK